MAISFPLSGDSSTKVRAWKSYGDFTRTIARWLLGAETPPGVGLRTRLVGSDLELSLLYDDTWQERISQHPPTAAIQIQDPAGAPVTEHPTWQKSRPANSPSTLSCLRSATSPARFSLAPTSLISVPSSLEPIPSGPAIPSGWQT